jgi:ATP-dependent Lhr-like helicase
MMINLPTHPTELQPALEWFASMGWQPFSFQLEAWQKFTERKSGLVNAPTGSGKTYSLLLPLITQGINAGIPEGQGLRAIWITPIRALGKEIEQAAQRALKGMSSPWKVETRTGDTAQHVKQRQKSRLPEILVTTPESLHILLATKGYPDLFKNLQTVVVDEWHELMGSKRAVQMELALSRLRGINPNLRTWGISATIGNMEEALEILLGASQGSEQGCIIRADIEKKTEVISVLPDDVETLPWAGHLGIRLLEKVIPVLQKSKSTLIFTNTRSQAEIWFQRLLEVSPDLAGIMAMHHSSISKDLRGWVEDALYDGRLKVVVCTSSLDLGVDFRPVETIIQIGSPKGVARFLQRAGRSGHRPGEVSRIYFVPTHSLELIEASALRQAITDKVVECRLPYIRSFDVLVQYLVTLAVSEGFVADQILSEIRNTSSFKSISDDEFNWCLNFITIGGQSLKSYDDFHKVVVEDGVYRVNSRRVALRHRLNMGTIVSDTLMQVKMAKGGFLGHVEEYFISKLKPGDVFWFSGRNLELVRVNGLVAQVRLSEQKTGIVPSWQGGRMPLSAELGAMLRVKLCEAAAGKSLEPELQLIQPLINLQLERSIVPDPGQLLIEKYTSEEGHHLFVYPFEGRLVHEGMAALLAFRLSLFCRITFTISMNDYGFELLSDQPIPIEEGLDSDIFSTLHLRDNISRSVNETELARRKFRDIARIAGLVFSGYPGKPVKDKHLQASAQLFFNVFLDYDPHNLLFLQAFEEVYDFQLEEARLRSALERISRQEIVIQTIEKPTPLCFPVMADRLSNIHLSSESLQDRIRKMMR